jgi:hypothetical protein
MAQRAIRNTFGWMQVGYGVERRVRIVAGQEVVPGVRLEDLSAVADDATASRQFSLTVQATGDQPAPAPPAPAPPEPAADARTRGAGGRFVKQDAAA